MIFKQNKQLEWFIFTQIFCYINIQYNVYFIFFLQLYILGAVNSIFFLRWSLALLYPTQLFSKHIHANYKYSSW